MRWGFALFCCLLTTQGCGDDGDDGPEEGGGEPDCHTVDLTNSTAVEKVNAAMCFAMGFEGAFGCQYDRSADTTSCDNGKVGLYVAYRETRNGTVGDVFDQFDDSRLGQVTQSSTGHFKVEFWLDPRATGYCSVTGDVATLCIDQ